MTTQLRPLSEVRTEAVREYYSDRTSYTRNQISLPLLTILTTDRDTAYTLLREGIEARKIDDTCGSCDGTAVNTSLRNGDDCPHCHGTGQDSSCAIQNCILDDILTLLDHIYGKTDALTK